MRRRTSTSISSTSTRANRRRGRPTWPKRLEPGKYDVILLGDIDSSAFSAEELAAMKLAVNRGAGLMMIGGLYNFGPGGYAETPLADVLPIEMNRLERQRFEDATRADVHLPGPLKMRPPRRSGPPDYIMHLADEQPGSLGQAYAR